MISSVESAPMGSGPKKELGNALNALANNIKGGRSAENRLISLNFPRFAYKFMANKGWNSTGKENGLSKKDLLRG